ncbi:hypothetical protein KH5_22710 [Urechidicola sp. KH5]
MKPLVALLFILTCSNDVSIEELRQNFLKVESEEQTEFYINELENANSVECQGYLAGMYFMKSRYAGFPLTKMKYFKRGKKLLEQLIAENPNHIELRYLRLIMQYRVPEFLGYHEHKQLDYNYITTNIESANMNSEFKIQILEALINIDSMSEEKISELHKIQERI